MSIGYTYTNFYSSSSITTSITTNNFPFYSSNSSHLSCPSYPSLPSYSSYPTYSSIPIKSSAKKVKIEDSKNYESDSSSTEESKNDSYYSNKVQNSYKSEK